jgi:molecular chaperone DnaK (HSP70)
MNRKFMVWNHVIHLHLEVDINGIITVTAEESDTHEKSSIIVNTNKGGLTKEQIENLVIEASELEARDEVERVTRLKFYQIDDICSNIKINIGNKNFKLSKSDQEIIEIDIQKTIIWLKEKKYFDRTMDELNETLETLKKKYGVLIVPEFLVRSDIERRFGFLSIKTYLLAVMFLWDPSYMWFLMSP